MYVWADPPPGACPACRRRWEEMEMKRYLCSVSSGLWLGLALAALVVAAGPGQMARGAERMVLGEEFTGLG